MNARVVAGLALSLALGAGCSKAPEPAEPSPEAKAADAAAPKTRRPRKKLKLPPPQPPPVRPAGEARSKTDLKKQAEAAAGGAPPAEPGAPPIERIDEFRLKIGPVRVDRKARTVRVPGKLNMDAGILEYFAVASGGKLHESVLEIDGQPSFVHLGLVLIGLDHSKYRPVKGRMPELAKPGDRMRMWVEWQDPKDGKARREPAEHFLYNRRKNGAPEPRDWIFEGSVFWNARYAADQDRSVIALIEDRLAVIVVPGDFGNPYRGDDLGFEVYTDHVPPVGTKVILELTIEGVGKGPAGGTAPGGTTGTTPTLPPPTNPPGTNQPGTNPPGTNQPGTNPPGAP